MIASDEKKKRRDMSLMQIVLKLLPMIFAAVPVLFILTNLAGALHGISLGLVTFVTQLFFDAVASAVQYQSELGPVLWMGAILGVVMLGSQVLNGVHNFMSNTFFKKMAGKLSVQINRKSSLIDPVSYENPSVLDDITKANEGMKNSLYLLFTLITIITFYLPYIVFMGIYLFSLKPILSLSLVLIFIPVALTQLIRGSVFAKLEDQSAPVRREYEYMERCICDREYFKETRLLGAYEFFKEMYRGALTVLGEKIWSAERKVGLLELGMKMLTLTGYFGILFLLFNTLLAGDISVGAFAAVFSSIGSMFHIMEEVIAGHVGNLTRNLGTVRNFFKFMELPERGGEDFIMNKNGGLILNHVSFRYPGARNESVSNVNLEIMPGETIAVVGENGAGKTTLVKLLIGLYLPTEGDVLIGNVSTKQVSGRSIYNEVSAVFQKYQKYKMTLNENVHISDIQSKEQIGYGDEIRLKSALEKANLEEHSFPQGGQTILSREFDGIDLSGGQWQRVAIARGFYRPHEIIVLDEPTASIDPLEETRLYHKFADLSKDKTTFIITHRLGSAKIADRIVVMDQGKIVEVGTHRDLMAAKGKYAEMFKAQARWYDFEEEGAI